MLSIIEAETTTKLTMGDHELGNTGSGSSWWKLSSSSSSSSSSSTSALAACNNTLGAFTWASTETLPDKKQHRSSNSIDSGASTVFHDHHLQMIGLGLSSQSPVIDQWNHQSLLRGDSKAETSFGLMLQENLNLDANVNANANNTTSSSYQLQQESGSSSHHQALWRDSSNRGFFLDHHHQQFSPHGSSSDSSTVTCQGFGVDNSSNTLYATNSSSTMFNQIDQRNQQSPLVYSQYGSSSGNYDQIQMSPATAATAMPSTWFLRSSPPPKPHSPLRFSNNGTFWNPAATGSNAGPHDVSSNFFPTLQPPQIHAPSFDEQPKGISEIRDSSSGEGKRGGGEQPAAKRAKSETVSPSPSFKVKKEKMGDRIAALQQLVSPFGKTDAASVLSEAIEYIKFLHQQVSALSNPYMKSGASLHHQQNEHERDLEVVEEEDLRSRGLCLVPVSSTFPMTHDTTVDFWTPTFGGTFR